MKTVMGASKSEDRPLVFHYRTARISRSPARTHFNLSLRGAQRRGNLVEVEHTPANHHCYRDEIATLRSQ